MRIVMLLALLTMIAPPAFGDWQLYWQDAHTAASFDILSRTPFKGQPALWTNWRFTPPRKGLGGKKIQFTADCRKHKLFEIASAPYDANGIYLPEADHYDAPREYPLTGNPLNKATYSLLCAP